MINNIIVRPIKLTDLESLYKLANTASYGLTTLPKDQKLLLQRIERSVCSFSKVLSKPHNELYLFVAEDILNSKIVGTTAIESSIGGDDYFFGFKKVDVEHKFTNKQIKQDLIQFFDHEKSASELCSLYLHPDYRNIGLGRYLSSVRFLFMYMYPKRFKSRIISEIRGVSYDDGKCPFWDYVMHPFFQMSFLEADYLSSQSKEFIKEFIPAFPIYTRLLPRFINNLIGESHKASKGAEQILISEGFEKTNYFDIFDAGPKYECLKTEIKAMNRAESCANFEVFEEIKRKNLYNIAFGYKPKEFVACCVPSEICNKKDKISVLKTNSMDYCLDRGKIMSYLKLYPYCKLKRVVSLPSESQLNFNKNYKFSKVFSSWYKSASKIKNYKSMLKND